MAVVTVQLDGDAARCQAERWLEQGYDVVCALVDGVVDLAVIDALARLHLVARRCGAQVRLRAGDVGRVRELLLLTGLSDLAVEVGREAEPREQ